MNIRKGDVRHIVASLDIIKSLGDNIGVSDIQPTTKVLVIIIEALKLQGKEDLLSEILLNYALTLEE